MALPAEVPPPPSGPWQPAQFALKSAPASTVEPALLRPLADERPGRNNTTASANVANAVKAIFSLSVVRFISVTFLLVCLYRASCTGRTRAGLFPIESKRQRDVAQLG
jgi:hypothetical protein